MRTLTTQEQQFVGTILVASFICFIPYSIIIETTRQPMIDWGKSILKTNEPLNNWGEQIKSGNYTNIYYAILYVILDYGRALSVLIFLKPAVSLTLKMGFPNKYPKNWLRFLYPSCNGCNSVFKTRAVLNAHKMECLLSIQRMNDRQNRNENHE